LGDSGEPLDPARQRRFDADQRAPRVVQLAPSDQDRSDLRQLAALARQPVGLRVDGKELGGSEGQLEHGPPSIRLEPDVMQAILQYRPERVRLAVALAGTVLLATACGDTEPRSNIPRPPAPITVTAAV